MKPRTILAVLGVLGAGAATLILASHATEEVRGEIRHGLWFDGCDAVSVVDPTAWGDHVLELVQVWIGEGRRDAAVMIAEAYAETIPECAWPPPEGSPLADQWQAMIPGGVAMVESMFPEGEAAFEIHTEPHDVDPPEVQPATYLPPMGLRSAKAGAGVCI